jgi:hypothetical protein
MYTVHIYVRPCAIYFTCRPEKLFPNFFDPYEGKWKGLDDMSMGSYGDSFYEYLLKEWIRTNKTDTLSKASNIFPQVLSREIRVFRSDTLEASKWLTSALKSQVLPHNCFCYISEETLKVRFL